MIDIIEIVYKHAVKQILWHWIRKPDSSKRGFRGNFWNLLDTQVCCVGSIFLWLKNYIILDIRVFYLRTVSYEMDTPFSAILRNICQHSRSLGVLKEGSWSGSVTVSSEGSRGSGRMGDAAVGAGGAVWGWEGCEDSEGATDSAPATGTSSASTSGSASMLFSWL